MGQYANRFDLLRLCAALAVFVMHARYLYRLQTTEPFRGHSLGSLGVYVFFFISGYLIQQSWSRAPRWRAYWAKRLRRIYPGLIAAVLFAVFVIGATATTLPMQHYLQTPRTWHYLLDNLLALGSIYELPGVFGSNPFPGSVNGSLWTIRYELSMYLLLAITCTLARNRRRALPLLAAGLALLWWIAMAWNWDAAFAPIAGRWWDVFRWREFTAFGVLFFVGASCSAFALKPAPWQYAVFLAGLALALLGGHPALIQVGVWAFVASGIFLLALAGSPSASYRHPDLSYGVYIYAFPLQQITTQFGLARGWSLLQVSGLSLALTFLCATFSWYLIEKPFLRGQRHRSNAR